MSSEQKANEYLSTAMEHAKPAVGTEPCFDHSYEEILKQDYREKPKCLRSRGTYRPGHKVVPYRYYTSSESVQREVENIWSKQWQVACRDEDIPGVGDMITYDIVGNSYVIVRSAPDEFRAYRNFCRHRGRKLCDVKGSGTHFRCAFHGWTYNLDGSLAWVPDSAQFPNLDYGNSGLSEVRVGRWGGHIFINPDSAAPEFELFLGPLLEHFVDFPMEQRHTVCHVRKKVRANWKVTMEAFMESYHVMETHTNGMPVFGGSQTQYDVWDDGTSHISRLITPSVSPDVWVIDDTTPEASASMFSSTWDLAPPARGEITSFADARRASAQAMADKIKATTGNDFSDRPIPYLVDMAQYYMFPNFFPWWGEGMPWWYRFLPIGDDPNKSMMEIRITSPLPKNGKQPAPPLVVDIDFDENGVDFPELGSLGAILDQDMSNITAVHEGMKSAGPGHAFPKLADPAEIRVRHFHEIYAKWMGI